MSDEAPGWDAIDAALLPLYGDAEPKHYGTVLSSELGGNAPLRGISAYKALTPRPHWHFVTYGFTELFGKETQDAETSGYGFELTFRLACDADEAAPPPWALDFLQNFGRYVFRTGNVFSAGDHLNLNGPIALSQETAIRAVLFARDPQLAPTRSPHGAFEFLQVVGITLDELQAVTAWNTERFLEVIARVVPLLITDLSRASILSAPDVAREVHEGAERDGSSAGMTFTPRVQWRVRGQELELIIGAIAVDELRRMLHGRLRFGRRFRLRGREGAVDFAPAQRVRWSTGEVATLELTSEAVEQLRAGLEPRRGRYTFSALPGVTIVIEPTEIKDPGGKVVVETIG